MNKDSATLVGLIAQAAGAGNAAAVRRYLGELGTALENVALDQAHAHQLVHALIQPGVLNGAVHESGFSPYNLIANIDAAAKQKPVDRVGLRKSWDDLQPFLNDVHAPFNTDGSVTLLDALRSSGSFDLLDRAAEAMFARGQDDVHTRRMYGQALIETGHPTAAIDLLNTTLLVSGIPPNERDELQGLLGRAHKQIYVNSVHSPGEAIALKTRFGRFLTQAITHYGTCYDPHDPGRNYWHGINLVALLRLAKMDSIAVPQGYDGEQIARGLIATLETKATMDDDPWLKVTLGEAYLALGNADKAAVYLAQFAQSEKVDTFQLQGTVRQLEQVWRLKAGGDSTGQILVGLKAALAARDGSVVTLSREERRQILNLERFETNVPGGAFVNLDLLKAIVRCASAVAAVKSLNGNTLGTGFLLRGSDLDPSLGQDLFLLTNAHVIWDVKKDGPGDAEALAPDAVTITFDGDTADGKPRDFKCNPAAEWQSPSSRHDATLVRLEGSTEHLVPLTIGDGPAHFVKEDTAKGHAGTKLAVLGHPKGGPLAVSVFGDLAKIGGTLVDFGPKDTPDPEFLRYRTPTEPGNSGSPVFEADTWRVVGLHHAGFPEEGKPRLRGQPGREMANEGIAIESIRKSIKEKLNPSAKKKPNPIMRAFGQNQRSERE